MIIAFIGYKQSGKSTASKHLQAEHGFKPHNFKDAVIEEIQKYFPRFIEKECELYNCTPSELFDKKPGHIRQFMQNFATELRRAGDEEYWIKKWEAKIGDRTVVDDCRFLNEASAIKQKGGILVKIIRTGQVVDDTHRSEQEFNQIIPDHTIEVATGEQELLYKKLDEIYANIM